MTRALIVDDQEQNLYMLLVLLQGHGYDVQSAHDGIEALEIARRQPPDILITDVLMPGMDGFRLCREWMADEQLKEIPLVFYTATYTDPKDEAFALSLGAAQFIVKPAEPDAFIGALEEVLETHAKRQLNTSGAQSPTEEVYYQQYNQTLIRKLEDKMQQLEEANHLLRLDIAAREKVEEERAELTGQIREQAQQMAQVLATVPAGVFLLDAEGRIIMANPLAEQDLALLSDAQIGDVLTYLGDRPLSELLTSPVTKGLWHEVRSEGSIFEVLARPMANGPEPERYVVVINDVTRERMIQTELQQQERLAAVGQLAAGVAHDFNNILAIILLYAQMDLKLPELPGQLRSHLQTIAQEAQQASNLIQQILDFGRRAVLEPHPLDLAPFLKERVKLLSRTLPESIEVRLTLSADEAIVKADPTRMQQMITNLAVNARDAMPTGGELSIALEKIQLERDHLVPVHGMRAGSWIRIAVSDTGMGIPPEIRAHIFEPFFTTKEPGKGTGLGLAQVYGIVKQHDGYIDLQTKLQRGTVFTVYLPALEAAAAADDVVMPSSLPLGHGERILVVEDNLALREAVVTTLHLLNYQTVEARNGRQALSILDELGEEIGLVLSDLVMPEMGGQTLFYTLREQPGAPPIVMMTGHPMKQELMDLQADGLAGWVLKPPSIEDLALMLTKGLRQEGTAY